MGKGKTRAKTGSKASTQQETMCLNCCSLGFIKEHIDYKWHYKIEEYDCPVCKKNTKHVVCRKIEDLKTFLRFCSTRRELDDMVLEIFEENDKKMKQL